MCVCVCVYVCVCVCMLVCVCEESTAQEQSLYNDKLSRAAEFLLHFRDFQLTELSEVHEL